VILLFGVCFSTFGAGGTPLNASHQNNPHPTPLGAKVASEPIPSQVIIKFLPQTSENEKKAFVQAHGGKVLKRIDALNILVIHLPENAQDKTNLKSSIVESVESDYYVSALDEFIPNDPRYSEQWALPAIGAPAAWGQMPLTLQSDRCCD
jgi:hypothetical protein